MQEVISQRKRFSKLYRDGNKFRCVSSTSPLHYEDDNGDFQDIDISFKQVTGGVVVQRNSFQFAYIRNLNGHINVLRFKYKGAVIHMSPKALLYRNADGEREIISKAKPVVPSIDGRELVFSDVFGRDIDVRFEVTPVALRKKVIIKRRNALPAPTIGRKGIYLSIIFAIHWNDSLKPDFTDDEPSSDFDYELDSEDLPSIGSGRSMEFKTLGKVVAKMMSPYAEDAYGNDLPPHKDRKSVV